MEDVLEGKRVAMELKKEEMEDSVPPGLFVFCGNFRSRPFLFNGEAVREYQGRSLPPHATRTTC